MTHSSTRAFAVVASCRCPLSSLIFLPRTQHQMKIDSAAIASMAFAAAALSSAKAFTAQTSITSAGRRFVARSLVAMASSATSTDTDGGNPLLDITGLPKFASIEPKHLTPAVQSVLTDFERDFESLESKLATTSPESYDEVLPEVERMQEKLGYVWGVAGHLNGVKNSDDLRAAYEENQPKVVELSSKVSQSKTLFDALKSIEKSWEASSPGTNDFKLAQMQRAVDLNIRSMTLGGVGLEGAEKERFNEIKMRLAELSTKFSNNVLDATKAFGMTIDDPKDVEGVPSSAKGMWAAAYAAHAKAEDPDSTVEPDAEKGPWRVTLDGPSYISAMSHLPNRDLREKVYMGYLTRASELNDSAGGDNVPLIYEILELKTEMAKMLGYDNYADLSLARKMAPSVDAVRELSDLIADKALPAAIKEVEEITALARKNGGDEYSEEAMEKLAPWDVTYWSERLKESKFELKEEELRPYFELNAVLDGMFSLFERIFNIEVRRADGDAEVWDESVMFFHVHDKESGDHIASFYLDPYSRPADKRPGAWMDVCIGKSDACKRDVPVAYLTCNGSPPVGDKPSLMTFRESETLFHEAGHGLQHMLTRASIGDVAGINGVDWDAVELPSQFMENWLYDEPTLYGFAKHYETGEPLPKEMFEKLKLQKTYGAGMMACRQLYFGQMDLELHSNFNAAANKEGGESIFDVQRRVAEKYSPYNMPLPEDRFLCAFSHIFAGGYAAGYYSYKWAEVMSADAFGAFEEVGLDNEEEVKRVGKLFRDTVLSLGGGIAPGEVFRMFRGRDPSPEALLRHNGLA